jgi:arsenite methyltransferase
VVNGEYWQNVYLTRPPQEVGWYEPDPIVSRRLVLEARERGAESVIDVGGGASALVDHLLDLGFPRIAVLDVSEAGMAVAKRRLGHRAEGVEWLVGDVTAVASLGMFDVWHDRATFHFLVDAEARAKYVRLASETIRPGGTAIVATFAPEGPERCSGLPVCRYDDDQLAQAFGAAFRLLASERHTHTTPRGVAQQFSYFTLARVAAAEPYETFPRHEDPAMTEVTTPSVDIDALRGAIRNEYAAVAEHPDQGFHFHTGAHLAAILGYPAEWIDSLPVTAVESMAGTGNPFALGDLGQGESVVDCGSGAGADSLIAARLVGPTGRVIGVDMTPEMVAKARANADLAGFNNVEFRLGMLEALPVPDGWADVVISNGVLNLVPEKELALGEFFRVLRSGGRIQLADIVLDRPVGRRSKADVSLWTGCIAGGLVEDDLRVVIEAAGFRDVEIRRGADVFSGAPQHSNAADFGTIGAGIVGRKP